MPEQTKPRFPQRQSIQPLRAPRVGTVTDSWIYELTNRTAGGGEPYVPPAAPPVIIDGATVTPGYDYTFTIEVNYHKNPAATATNYKAAAVYLEDPDLSEKPNAPMDGSVLLDGSTVLSGKWNPTRYADSTKSPASIVVDAQPVDRYIRIMLVAYHGTAAPVPIRNTEPSPSPSIRVLVPAASPEYQKGSEYAWRVSNVSVDVIPDFDNILGPKYQLRYYYDEPAPAPLPPGMLEFGGVQIVFEYPDHTQARAQYLTRRRPETWISESYPIYATTDFDVYFASADITEQANSVVHGWTPKASVHIDFPPAGQGSTPGVGAFTLVRSYHEFAWDGTATAAADVTWTNPDSNRYAGVRFFHAGVQIGGDVLAGADGAATLRVINFPNPAVDWQIYAIAYDRNNTLADDPANPTNSPSITWNIGPPAVGGSGQEWGSATAIDIIGPPAATVTTTQELGSDGVVRMRHTIQGWKNPAADPKFGGVTIVRTVGADLTTAVYWDAQKNETKLVTDWEPATTVKDGSGPGHEKFKFWFLYRDMTGHRNSIAPGLTPSIDHVFTPIAGDILASRLPRDWWNPDEFVWPEGDAGKFQALSFVAKKIYVGSILRVGGGTNVGVTDPSFKGFENGQIAVYNSSNKLRGWIGQQDIPAKGSIFGAWFKELYVGGLDPTTAPLYADSNGLLILGGFLPVDDPDRPPGSKVFPYLSVRNASNYEYGRIGAKLNQGFGTTDSWGQPTPDIGGAWFYELAIGGATMPDWQILSSAGKLKFRNINSFTIDYGSGPSNAAQRFTVGQDMLFANMAGTRSFAGLKMERLGTSGGYTPGSGIGGETGHWAMIINRGFLAAAPVVGGEWRRAWLGTFNGDNTGADTALFWGEMTLFNNSGKNTVRLSSQDAISGSPGAVFWMTHSTGSPKTINIDGDAGVIDTYGGYKVKGTLVIDAAGGGGFTAVSSGGFINATSGYQVGGNNIVDLNRNATFNSVTSSSYVTATGNVGGATLSASGNAHVGSLTVDGSFSVASMNTTDGYSVDGSPVIDGTGVVVGIVAAKTQAVGGKLLAVQYSGNWAYGLNDGNGAAAAATTKSFTTADGKTVTVVGGLITSITP